MIGTVKTKIERTNNATIRALGEYGVATVHEAQDRVGLMSSSIRPLWPGARMAGSAVTALCPAGDNWMIHVAIEQMLPGDVLVVAMMSPSDAGYFGDLLATLMQARGAAGIVIDAGARDVREIAEMRFPAWSRAICAQGTVKETLGSVNFPVVCAGAEVKPGDAVIGDDDGVCVVRGEDVENVLRKSIARAVAEAEGRKRFADGELSIDVAGMREKLTAKGLCYV